MKGEKSRSSSAPPATPDPARFEVARGTLRMDAFMTRFILVGGFGVIFAIFGIFFFILAEILPLFRGARVEPMASTQTGIRDVLVLGTDEWSERPFLLTADGNLHFLHPSGREENHREPIPLPEGARITSAAYMQESQAIALGLDNGQILTGRVVYASSFSQDGVRTINARAEWDKPTLLDKSGLPVTGIDLHAGETRKAVAGLLGEGESQQVAVLTLVRKRSLFGTSEFSLEDRISLPASGFTGKPVQVLVGAGAEALAVRTNAGTVHVYSRSGGEWRPLQTFAPFEDSGSHIASMNYIQGKVSLSFTSTGGRHVAWSLYRTPESGERRFGMTKEFDPFPGGAEIYATSLRNKAFLLGNGQALSLRYATTADTRWEQALTGSFAKAVISAKFDRILALEADGTLRQFSLDDPHPEAGFRAYFARIWYEGQDQPRFLWQSTGGSDDFEPKLSLIPLIVGSFKGTFYALIFAIPIALLSAVYTSQFLHPDLKRIVKPGIEIMASLPSVVLGFLAALWLAPLIEDRVPSVLLLCIVIPATAVLFGYLWNLLPARLRVRIPNGREFLVFLPVLVLASMLAWQLGPLMEQLFFRYTDPITGEIIADFRLWWEARTGNQFQQRNSLIVGFMMGFAVIPIIYTIAEDALSAVPSSLVSGSLALGASRWQTTARIVLPTASAGIFSACMIGLGRAVGETMIVVMATGNTPILDFDIFSGMRTLSANIAVELPEAPHGGTLYRTLFLGAFVLFVLTFIVNTVAEVLRTRLRERFKVVS